MQPERIQASFGKGRPNETTLGEAHALAVLYGNASDAPAVHQLIAACAPESGFMVLAYPCTYGEYYGKFYAKRRWVADAAADLSQQLHELARLAIQHRSEVEAIHRNCFRDYRMIKDPQDRKERASRFCRETRAILVKQPTTTPVNGAPLQVLSPHVIGAPAARPSRGGSNITHSHESILALQDEIKNDLKFQALCELHGLPWDFSAGYEPRWYNGPPPEETSLLFFMAEPGAITKTERHNLLPAILHQDWIGTYDLRLQEHYWRDNLRQLCRYIWPTETERNMYAHVGGTCTFWMSLPPGSQTNQVPRPPLDFFLQRYLPRLLNLFPNAVFLAAGGKAAQRLKTLGVAFETCSAFTRPESNKPRARASWQEVGSRLAAKLHQ